jgi:hypothetical protein
MMREIVEEYVNGDLDVPEEPKGGDTVRTSVWMPKALWHEFTELTRSNGVSTQWVMRNYFSQSYDW